MSQRLITAWLMPILMFGAVGTNSLSNASPKLKPQILTQSEPRETIARSIANFSGTCRYQDLIACDRDCDSDRSDQTVTTASVPDSRPLPIQSLAVGGIAILFTEAQVREVLGNPTEVRAGDNPLLGGEERYLYYSKRGIHGVQLIKGKASQQFQVVSVLVNNTGSATYDGIQVGDNRQKLLQTYGSPTSIWQQGDDVQILSYSSHATPASFDFTLLGDRITEIRLSRNVSL
jgi:hypothetical protein